MPLTFRTTLTAFAFTFMFFAAFFMDELGLSHRIIVPFGVRYGKQGLPVLDKHRDLLSQAKVIYLELF